MSAAAAAAALRLATRGSALAQAQTALAAAVLQRSSGRPTTPVVVRTSGDRQSDIPLDRLEGQGWFTAELERELLEGAADIAVHSAKDLPTAPAPRLVIAAYLERGDPRDGVVTREGRTLAELPAGAGVGTGSARRVALLGALYPGLAPRPMRGNVDTRLRKLAAGEVDALLIACAGLERLTLGGQLAERLDPTVFVPAPAQGAIALQCVSGSVAHRLCAALNHPATAAAVTAERSTLAALGGGCLLPLGAWARQVNERLMLTAALAVDGVIRRVEMSGDPEKPEDLGIAAASALR